jgi:hypothetical protein
VRACAAHGRASILSTVRQRPDGCVVQERARSCGDPAACPSACSVPSAT